MERHAFTITQMTFSGSSKTLSLRDISALETRLGHSLPPEYAKFLLLHNGGMPEFCLYAGTGEMSSCVVQFFYSVGRGTANLEDKGGLLPYPLPANWMVIANEGGGKCICLNWESDTIGLLDWETLGEHEYVLPTDMIELESTVWEFLNRLSGESYVPPEENTIGKIAGTGDVEALRAFVASGGDINAPSISGKTAAQIATLHEDIHFLAACSQLGAALDGALHIAASFNHIESAEWLLQHNANINEQDAQGRTPIALAAPITGVYHLLKKHEEERAKSTGNIGRGQQLS